MAKLWNRHAPQMVGIDIGSHDVKAMLLEQMEDGYKVVGYACVPIKKGAVVDHDLRDPEAVIETLRQLVRQLPKGVKYAAVAVSGSAVITKVIYMDASLNEEEMEAQIEIEADNLIPYSLDEVSIDFETLQLNSTDSAKVDVLLSACRTENVDGRVDALDAVGLEAKVVDVESYALGRSAELIYNQLPSGAHHKTLALVNVGANITSFAVVDHGETVFVREQTFGGEHFTQSIQACYGMTYEEAEKAKISGQLPENYVLDVHAPFQAQLVQQIKRTLQIYCSSRDKDKVDYIVLCGGAAQLDGLASLLTSELAIQTRVANPFQGCLFADDDIRLGLETGIGKYMVACGLALRSYGQWRT